AGCAPVTGVRGGRQISRRNPRGQRVGDRGADRRVRSRAGRGGIDAGFEFGDWIVLLVAGRAATAARCRRWIGAATGAVGGGPASGATASPARADPGTGRAAGGVAVGRFWRRRRQ